MNSFRSWSGAIWRAERRQGIGPAGTGPILFAPKEDHMAASKKLVYKGLPLRRKDNLIYYGNMSDKYIVMLQILDTEPVQDLTLAKRVSVQLQLTDPDIRSRDRVVKKSEKEGLYTALDLGAVWLERARTNG